MSRSKEFLLLFVCLLFSSTSIQSDRICDPSLNTGARYTRGSQQEGICLGITLPDNTTQYSLFFPTVDQITALTLAVGGKFHSIAPIH